MTDFYRLVDAYFDALIRNGRQVKIDEARIALIERHEALAARLAEAVAYLDSNPLNAIHSGSVLHRKMAGRSSDSASAETFFTPGRNSDYCRHCDKTAREHERGGACKAVTVAPARDGS